MNDRQLDMVLGYLNEGTEIDEFEWLVESIQEEMNRFEFVNEKVEVITEGAIIDKFKKIIKFIKQKIHEFVTKVRAFMSKKILEKAIKIRKNRKKINESTILEADSESRYFYPLGVYSDNSNNGIEYVIGDFDKLHYFDNIEKFYNEMNKTLQIEDNNKISEIISGLSDTVAEITSVKTTKIKKFGYDPKDSAKFDAFLEDESKNIKRELDRTIKWNLAFDSQCNLFEKIVDGSKFIGEPEYGQIMFKGLVEMQKVNSSLINIGFSLCSYSKELAGAALK